MYAADADAHQAGLFGLSLDEIPEEVIHVWDCNWDAFNIFYTMNTQWRIGGMGSATGLDYNVIPTVGKMLGIKKKRINEVFSDIQVMENEALITMGENLKDANNR